MAAVASRHATSDARASVMRCVTISSCVGSGGTPTWMSRTAAIPRLLRASLRR